jgi:hypothetical protein
MKPIDTKPISVEQTGPQTMQVEHEDGSKFDCKFNGKFPERLKHDKKPPVGSGKYFGGIGQGSENIRKMRERLGLD